MQVNLGIDENVYNEGCQHEGILLNKWRRFLAHTDTNCQWGQFVDSHISNNFRKIYKRMIFFINSGLNPKNKKIIRILKISSDFQDVFLSKNLLENFQKSVQPAAPKCLDWKFLRFSEKIGGVQNFQIFFRKFLRNHIFVDIKSS